MHWKKKCLLLLFLTFMVAAHPSCTYPAYLISSIICHFYFKRFLMCPYHSQEADSESLSFVNGHVITSNGSHLYGTQCVATETARLLHLPQFDCKVFSDVQQWPKSITQLFSYTESARTLKCTGCLMALYSQGTLATVQSVILQRV